VLRWLSIEGLALVESVELEFHAGLNVLTGETGAGKSIVLGSIGLLLGERADADWVRAGRARGSVEGTFDLSSRPDLVHALSTQGVEAEEGALILRREVGRDGKSRAFVNGRSALISQLRPLGDLLVDLHGQHEHQHLLLRERQTDFYDAWAGLMGERAALEASRDAVRAARREADAARAAFERDRADEARLREDLAELTQAGLAPGEEERLRDERDRLKHRERHLEALGDARHALSAEEEGAESLLRRAARALRSLASAVPAEEPLAAEAEEVLGRTRDLLSRIEESRDRALAEPLDLDALEERLHRLHRLKRKHDADVDGLIVLRDSLAARVKALDPAGFDLAARERALAGAEARYAAALDSFLAKRAGRFPEFGLAVGTRLARLGFGRGALSVGPADPDRGRPAIDPLAIPALEFGFQPNEGEAPRALARIASGGELSRVMLAIKSLLAEQDRVATLVFDEVDQGIGGAVGEEVGQLLQNVSEKRQVLCITHLPLLAAHATRHFEVAKQVSRGRTETTVRPLTDSEREGEIARLLAGDRVSDTTRRQAREILAAARPSRPAGPARARAEEGAERARAPRRTARGGRGAG
jgi:DNA repair protein RecN (Recombination protein N)